MKKLIILLLLFSTPVLAADKPTDATMQSLKEICKDVYLAPKMNATVRWIETTKTIGKAILINQRENLVIFKRALSVDGEEIIKHEDTYYSIKSWRLKGSFSPLLRRETRATRIDMRNAEVKYYLALFTLEDTCGDN